MSRMTKTPLVMLISGMLLGTSAYAEDKLTVVSWGGAFTKSQVEAYHKPFIQKTGVEIVSEDFSGGLAEIKAQVEANNVRWDLVSLDKPDIVRGCAEGLLEPVNHSILPPGADGTPAKEDFIDGAIHECAINTIVVSTVLAVNEDAFKGKAAPTKLTDLFDLTNFPGRRALQKQPQGNLEWALLADGVKPDEVYRLLETEEGRARAFAKLDTIKPQVLWWTTGAQPPQMLADKEVVIASAFNGRIHNARKDEGQPFRIIWDHQMGYMNGWAIPKGSANTKLALDFIAFSSGTKPLADQAKYVAYGPTRKSSSAEVSPEILANLPTAPQNFKTAFLINDEWWSDYADELNEEFNTWLLN
ncbi:TPA: polyamine ABC transporter substrate-binding protein [Vibrio parahaemolyticus]|uniref:polyamine ABC transporter substrate-binding protein n=1 Tax=Vibrio parahaemolyticus TaxID=670 RepID=UPI000813396C|nr:ABC transporter substrate-binding protein [Vibrio parahaemolyticus]EGQ9458351.1 extracellular solute-binding protein [Vibrio parahaemolyticus]EJE4688233.1 polyamine ABC transporter substrate-binding protein [Vibrio parahaemolyticus]EJK2425413.1 polyamine ABC transporter substrate-binding protein [Vibrio parahaemolyticus]OCP70202.1 spermidine/putrescine ABC transporter substrate-binding protein [Vibrio parahaemolyticus]HCG6866645.1 polyamine ABC transporter substrate-binding protein [Vibrio 